MASLVAIPATRFDATKGDARPARWSAVYAMALCSFVLVASEFLPVSLLSPIAETLRLTEGQAGQAIAISGVFAVVTSLSFSILLGRIDRRHVVLALIAMLIVSGAMVAFAPSHLIFMTGRALLGIAIGGFWSMSAAIAIRLVPEESVGKALAIMSGGTALATALAAPMGSFLGSLIGWRGAFFCVVPVAVGALVWQASALPKLPVAERQSARAMLGLLHSKAVLLGLFAVAMLFVGQFALFTYLRPFLEQVTHVGVVMLSAMLLIVGASGFVGTVVIGRFIVKRLFLTLWLLPVAMAAVAIGLALFGSSTVATALLLAVWGFAGTAAPVGWWTWLARTLPEDAEAGGGLMVAVVQLAITLGAIVGGAVYDTVGAVPEFLSSAALLGLAAIAAFAVARHDRANATL
ncbi:putative MFS family arabinose efflux permease [Sphingomonas sp. PP-F2F-A104-K0414]|uniref:MFS transporter n=1 Tax=Sphingomonas sp. PP-F2F-A104-K0414 TaxID=2135661 RepID=UPI001042C916|nr:MFS transporter [Sphingomonas sp. PP-F2F-A104-K0414]TCQ00456.1 putative MFS family arabinose efflux permease [Sphingomonas sp. PP-F2F-A104-K0414]